MNLILFGFKSVGKTYLGRLLSSLLKRPFIDTDDMIRSMYREPKYSCREIHLAIGDGEFRQLEKKAILQLKSSTNSIIAIGGGAVLRPDNVELLRQLGKLVYLRASFSTLEKRILEMPSYAKTANELYRIYCERLPVYESLADGCIDLDLLDTAGCLQELQTMVTHGL